MINKSILMDKFGICLSVCCGLHCLITPLFLTLGALEFFDFLANEQLEFALSLGVLVVGIIAILPPLRLHRNYSVMVLFIVGFLVLKASELIPMLWMQVSILVAGVLMIIIAHYFNIKLKIKHAERIK